MQSQFLNNAPSVLMDFGLLESTSILGIGIQLNRDIQFGLISDRFWHKKLLANLFKTHPKMSLDAKSFPRHFFGALG